MDAEALATFLTVHREGGFSRAARLLHRTQPAISRRIQLLEQELGVPLFERTAAGIALSQAGRVLLPHAERALAALQDAEAAVRALAAGGSGPVALAVVGTLAGPMLGAALKRFAAAHPAADVTLRTARSAEVSELVRLGEASIGLRFERDRSPDLHSEPLGAEPLLVACAADHPLAGRRLDTLAELRDARWLAFPEIPGQREVAAAHVFGVFLALGLGEVAWTPVDSLTAQKRLVEAGLGVALMPGSSIREEVAAGVIATIGADDLTAAVPVHAVTRAGGYLSPAAEAMLDLLRSGFAAALASQRPLPAELRDRLNASGYSDTGSADENSDEDARP